MWRYPSQQWADAGEIGIGQRVVLSERIVPNKHETFSQCWYSATPSSTMLAQHCTKIGWTSRNCLICSNESVIIILSKEIIYYFTLYMYHDCVQGRIQSKTKGRLQNSHPMIRWFWRRSPRTFWKTRHIVDMQGFLQPPPLLDMPCAWAITLMAASSIPCLPLRLLYRVLYLNSPLTPVVSNNDTAGSQIFSVIFACYSHMIRHNGYR